MTGSSSRRGRVFLEMLQSSGVREIFVSSLRGVPPGGRDDEAISKRRLLRPSGARNDVLSKEFLDLRKQVLQCTRCEELVANRHSVVFGSGNAHASLVLVGEAPGAEEDRQGLPFVGAAGQLLTKMLQAIHLQREEVFIANVLKCRPPGNRTPQPLEIKNCEPYLARQLALIRPKLICALGGFAAQTLLKTPRPISSLRGQIHSYEGIPVLCTFHPAYLLRNPGEKRKAWEDLKRLRALLDELTQKS